MVDLRSGKGRSWAAVSLKTTSRYRQEKCGEEAKALDGCKIEHMPASGKRSLYQEDLGDARKVDYHDAKFRSEKNRGLFKSWG